MKKLKTWKVLIHQSVGTTVIVKASTQEEAEEMALDGNGKEIKSDSYDTNVVDCQEVA